MIVLLISLGSNYNLLGSPNGYEPYFDLFKQHTHSKFVVSAQFNAIITSIGVIELKLLNEDFILDTPRKSMDMQRNESYPDLRSNQWTKEWKASDLPIFCKAEYHIQKKSGIAFRFRLGSLDYVNTLEGK